MASWKDFKDQCPELAGKVEARLRAHKHHVMATVRRDGAPRVSGTEVEISDDELHLGSMWEARKAIDLRRDPRLAVHANPGDGSMEGGDAKFSAIAVEVPDGGPAAEDVGDDGADAEPSHRFRLDLTEVVLTEVDQEAELLYVHLWRPGQGVRTTSRT
jgi:hypothetical protein